MNKDEIKKRLTKFTDAIDNSCETLNKIKGSKVIKGTGKVLKMIFSALKKWWVQLLLCLLIAIILVCTGMCRISTLEVQNTEVRDAT